MQLSSLSDIGNAVVLPGPGDTFDIAPDDATRLNLLRWQARYGELYGVTDSRGARHWVVHRPELVQQILVRRSADFTKGMGLDRVRILLGNGIMVSEGDFWTRQRRLLQPAFRPSRLADFNAMIWAENQALMSRLAQRSASDGPVDIAAQISELTLVIVLKSIFGADYPTLVEGGSNPFALLTEVPERNLRFAARFHRLKHVVERIIGRRRAANTPSFDFLGQLLAARMRDGSGMSSRALIDEVMTLIVAGHETTASALAWAWHLIAGHPAIVARLQAEARSVAVDELQATGGFGDSRLALTDRVIRETLRLYPPGWLLSRRAAVDTRLGEYQVAAGTQIFISPFVLHRDPDYWSAPDIFNPDRFSGDAEPAQRMAYLPFAAGPRHCIGEQLALTEMRLHLVSLLRCFTPHPGDSAPPVLESHINLRPANGIYLQLMAE